MEGSSSRPTQTPPIQQNPPVIQSFSLKGHSGSVLCLDHSSKNGSTSSCIESTLLSGSEDGTCRLWDLRTSGTRAALCIQCESSEPVLSVALGPQWSTNDDPSQHTSPFSRDYSVYTTVGTKVLGYDLRNVTSPILSVPSSDFSFLEAADEINQVLLSPPTRKSLVRGSSAASSVDTGILLATADDAGVVRVTECIEGKRNDRSYPTARVYSHGVDALVTAIAFAPRGSGKPVLLASGGTDCGIHLWDVAMKNSSSSSSSSSKRRSLLHSVSIPVTTTTTAGNEQLCNPPMVHSLDWSRSGRLLAAGLGDGSIAILQQNASSSLVLSSRIIDAHSNSVASCFFPNWSAPSNNSTFEEENPALTANDRLLCSAGNDGCIVLWDLGRTVGGDKANDPARIFPTLQQLDDDDDGTDAMRRSDVADGETALDEPETLFCVAHSGGKPNWVVSSGSRDTSFPFTLFVADTSSVITAYSIPTQ